MLGLFAWLLGTNRQARPWVGAIPLRAEARVNPRKRRPDGVDNRADNEECYEQRLRNALPCPLAPIHRLPHCLNKRPATASSLATMSADRTAGAVIRAYSSARSQPAGQGLGLVSLRRGAIMATSALAFSAFSPSTRTISATCTWSWSGCQQSKSVTMATV